MDVFSRKGLEAHNRYRAWHNVPPLTWCNGMAREAQIWAQKMAKAGKLMHQNGRKSGEGENVFMTSGGADFDDVGEVASNTWYAEVERYNFSKGGCQSGTGHFTQLVWMRSRELGMARAKGKDGSVFVVARYRPAGNDLSSYKDNVLPKVTKEPVSKQEKMKKPERMENKPKKKSEDMGPVRFTIRPSGGSHVDDNLKSRILDIHNNYRAMHDGAPLRWSAALAKDAQAWADKIAREGRLEHSSREDRYYKGENICRMSEHFDIGDALRIWYSEGASYDYDQPGFSLSTGHFTQIVWRGTSEIGVGFAKSQDGRLTYVVARYNPPGNILHKFAENVLPTELS